MHRYGRFLSLSLLCIASMVTSIATAKDTVFMDEAEPPRPEMDTEDNAWKEEPGLGLPTYPQDSDLVEFTVDSHGSTSLRYFIDTKSVTIGEIDQVVRYTIIIESLSGARNIAFEGLRCDSREYKTYAVGTVNENFQQLKNSPWITIKRSDQYRYHLDLREFYFCQADASYTPYEVSEILHRLGSAANNSRVDLF